MNKQPGYGILLGLTIISALLAVTTLIPAGTNPPSVLGYRSLCVWAPWSTLILAALAGTSCKLRSRFFKTH
jgi:hypothetical protein